MSLGTSSITTAPKRSLDELFRIHYNLEYNRLQLIPESDQENTFFTVSPDNEPDYLFIEDATDQKDDFFIVNTFNNRWLTLQEDRTFGWTTNKSDRAVFSRVAKMADNEGQVGELAPGEVAFYEHRAYHGRTWILSDNSKDRSGSFAKFSDFEGLDNQISSIRLGPDTGVTLFAQESFEVTENKREIEIEDITQDVPDLLESQIGNDQISSVKIFQAVPPEKALTSYSSKLSQDYRLVNGKLEEFSAYRTILRFAPEIKHVELSATDLTQIEVEDTVYEIDEERSVTLSPNESSDISNISSTPESILQARPCMLPNQRYPLL